LSGFPDGTQHGYVNFGFIFQDVPATLTAGTTYTLTAFLGRRTDNSGALDVIELDTVAGTVLASSGIIIPPLGDFQSSSLSFTATTGDPNLGQQMRIVFRTEPLTAHAQGQLDVDQVSLLSSVPEPSSIALMGSGFLSLLVYVRRRRSKVGSLRHSPDA
jgi:PEP-CTERM motif